MAIKHILNAVYDKQSAYVLIGFMAYHGEITIFENGLRAESCNFQKVTLFMISNMNKAAINCFDITIEK